MGSPLGPTFADFYMSNLERKILNEPNNFNPKFYIRYVDDTLTIFEHREHIVKFIERLEQLSCLRFTYEESVDNNISFLDIKININQDSSISTSVYSKPTDNGVYLNYNSYSPEIYKKSIVKTLVHRAYTICSDWPSFDAEIKRIKQNLVNCCHPLSTIDRLINETVSKLYLHENNITKKDKINFFFRTYNPIDFNKEEKCLRSILSTHLSTTNERKLCVKLYHVANRMSTKFSTRNKSDSDPNHVVYLYKCPESDCTSEYIGYTTNRLSDRAYQHRFMPSGICQHLQKEHNLNRIPNLLDNFKILYKSNEVLNLKIAEAFYIRNNKPEINTKYNIISIKLNII